MPEGFVSMKEAQEILGVSNQKMWRLVKEGVIETLQSPLDQRVKLIRRADLDAMLELQPTPTKGTATPDKG